MINSRINQPIFKISMTFLFIPVQKMIYLSAKKLTCHKSLCHIIFLKPSLKQHALYSSFNQYHTSCLCYSTKFIYYRGYRI